MDFTWFALDCNIWTNPKISKLAVTLGIDLDAAVCKVARIWSWAMLSDSEDGDITYIPSDELSGIARWKKKPDVFINALLECGFIDEKDGRKFLHGWSDVNGKYPAKKRYDRERKSAGNSTEIPRKNNGKVGDTVTYTVTNTKTYTNTEDNTRESGAPVAAPSPAHERHKHGEYGWVRLTDAEYARLVTNHGEALVRHYIAYVDESAQRTGNKNHWKDWNLTVRKAIREAWGDKKTAPPAVIDEPVDRKKDMENMKRYLEKLKGGHDDET